MTELRERATDQRSMARSRALHEAEHALVMLTAAEHTRWQEVSRVLMRVKRDELWRDTAPSFTAWVRDVAARTSMQPSSFWRALRAGRFVLERTGATDADAVLDGLQVGAQSIELAEKIARYAPDEIAEDIVQRTLAGEMSYANLRDTWMAYRPASGGLTTRGRLPDDPAGRQKALAEREGLIEANKRLPDTRDALATGELLTLLAHTEWLGSYDEAHSDRDVEVHKSRADLLVTVRRDARPFYELELHAVCVRGSMRHLDEQPLDPALRTSMNRVWMAAPAAPAGKLRDALPAYVGILTPKDGEVRVLREAKALNPSAAAQVPWMAALLARAHRWSEV